MHLRRLIPLTLALALWAPAAQAAPPAGLTVLACNPAHDGDGGSVEYRARMRDVPGTAVMALRFRLLEKVGDGDYQRVSGKGLGVWRKSERGAAAFQWTQRVEGLREGAVYRAVVRYRWFDGDGREIRSDQLRSAACKQPGDLPNLRVAGIEVKRGDVEDTAIYRVTVANRGDSSAHHVAVLLRVDGEVVDESEVIDVLAPGETRTVSFSGPVCRHHMKAVVDPKDLIPETREHDNSRSPGCV